MKKILVTGGCGFVGSNIIFKLKKKFNNYRFYSLDNLSRKGSKFNYQRLKNDAVKNYCFDIASGKKILKLPKFSIIIDCCAEAAVEFSKKDYDRVISTNFLGTYNLLKKAKKDKSKIIFISSSRVYSINDLNNLVNNKKVLNKEIKIKKKIDEDFNVLNPRSIYGFSKLSSELLIQEFSYAFGIKYLINRCGVLSGPWQYGVEDQGFMSLWMRKHLAKGTLKYKGFGGYGNQVRDVLHIDDLCRLLAIQVRKITKVNNLIFNVGGGLKNAISLIKLTQFCQKITGNKIKIRISPETSIYDIPYYVTNNKKVSSIYNWYPKKNLLNILYDLYSWMNAYKKIFLKIKL
jgi:CDP-paratose 2-epimerase